MHCVAQPNEMRLQGPFFVGTCSELTAPANVAQSAIVLVNCDFPSFASLNSLFRLFKFPVLDTTPK